MRMLAWKACRSTTGDLVVTRINSTSYPGKKRSTRNNNGCTYYSYGRRYGMFMI
jgi:hypothetical protein